jgi:hypothetical protein
VHCKDKNAACMFYPSLGMRNQITAFPLKGPFLFPHFPQGIDDRLSHLLRDRPPSELNRILPLFFDSSLQVVHANDINTAHHLFYLLPYTKD